MVPDSSAKIRAQNQRRAFKSVKIESGVFSKKRRFSRFWPFLRLLSVMSSPSSSQPSQPEPARDSPPIRPTRRLQTPAERFGVAPILELPLAPENLETSAPISPDDPFAVLPPLEKPPRSRRERHQRKRHETARATKKPVEKAHFEKKPIAGHENSQNHEKFVPTPKKVAPDAAPRSPKKFKRIFGRLALLAALFFAVQTVVAAFTAPQFRIDKVAVSGLQETPRAQIDRLLAPLQGKNVFLAPRAQVARQIEALPTVASAKVRLNAGWPPRVALALVERQAIFRVGEGANQWVVDREGVLFRRAATRDDALYRLETPFHQLKTAQKMPKDFWARALDFHETLQSDNALAAQNTGASETNQAPFWNFRRIELDKKGALTLELARAREVLVDSNETSLSASTSPNAAPDGASDASAARPRPSDALILRLGNEEWASKLMRARQALAYLTRTGRKAAELDLISYKYPRWRPVGAPPIAARGEGISMSSKAPHPVS